MTDIKGRNIMLLAFNKQATTTNDLSNIGNIFEISQQTGLKVIIW